ncbi:OLC1v1005925C1 [Oldenlandia corymbosa var. corymbosa]|uniref:OLC1v1005925C1 n=1 Tax=Oldenlandia corymbosa var. corymbosa TaxID=529605 RepID=A0AAV1DIF5_OLDCO|nr:OLC1v1005925C1 [Oldenlandia corymbosa var. corymbosa]
MPSMKKNNEGVVMEGLFSQLLKGIGDPVDFELPEYLTKCKPITYKLIKRNIYLTKKNKRRPEDDGIFCFCKSSTGSSGVCDKDCLCGMLQSSCSSNCQCGPLCLNKPFHERPVKKMKIVQTEKCGSGIVADEDIKQGEFVIEYVGEVIDDKECEERLWKMKHSGEQNFYLCEINRDMVIDATYKGNESRYINHSCCPNTEMQKWRIDNETRIGIFATRNIKKGEHLTYDYQFVQFGADQNCYCGAAGCRQKLGVKPNKTRTTSSDTLEMLTSHVALNSPKVKAFLSTKDGYANGVSSAGVRCNSAGRKRPRNCIGSIVIITRSQDKRYFGIVKQFEKSTNRHLILFEDGTWDLLDMSKEDWELL